MNEKLKLYFGEDLVGTLSYDNELYTFEVNNNLNKKWILQISGFDQEDHFTSKKIFNIFIPFLESKEREDVQKMLDLTGEETDFELLLKIATLKANRNEFWISLN